MKDDPGSKTEHRRQALPRYCWLEMP